MFPTLAACVERYVDYGLDEYPQGTNAVVAVISYTGYDMEDAMILNKSSFERGFGHGSVYKTVRFVFASALNMQVSPCLSFPCSVVG